MYAHKDDLASPYMHMYMYTYAHNLDLESPRLLESPRGIYEYTYKFIDVRTQT